MLRICSETGISLKSRIDGIWTKLWTIEFKKWMIWKKNEIDKFIFSILYLIILTHTGAQFQKYRELTREFKIIYGGSLCEKVYSSCYLFVLRDPYLRKYLFLILCFVLSLIYLYRRTSSEVRRSSMYGSLIHT